ncbi:C40 family peptidase [Pontibacter harenae]|uniref:C40 family peptidase n=1 Tax=Pontibacter harenae TaxID=2894083 RepID=UPI001E5064C3|nr:NlpC/P60 family protein [Pontibacter harenae]MCC9166456.1 NlpC/P60 family protein [Pontibacter harenae]
MTRTLILSVLAILSLTLSFLYEVTPAQATESTPATFISPYAINSGEDMANALTLKLPEETATEEVEVDSLFYDRYSKKLGLHLEYHEDKQLIATVAKWLGTPYRYGNSSKKGTDCSGFVTSIYREVYGVDLSRSSRSMFQDVQRIKKDSIRTGDLVFFKRSPKQPIYHVGIYLKNNKFIHAATNGGVMVSSLREPYYRQNYYAAGRVN